jgi:hypothetical protein
MDDDFLMVNFVNLNYKFKTLGTALVGGGVGGVGGGEVPASNLAAPKPATINAAHKHNFNLFIINPLLSVNCLKFILLCLKMRIENFIARLMPKTRLFTIPYLSILLSTSYIHFGLLVFVALFCESVNLPDSKIQKNTLFHT